MGWGEGYDHYHGSNPHSYNGRLAKLITKEYIDTIEKIVLDEKYGEIEIKGDKTYHLERITVYRNPDDYGRFTLKESNVFDTKRFLEYDEFKLLSEYLNKKYPDSQIVKHFIKEKEKRKEIEIEKINLKKLNKILKEKNLNLDTAKKEDFTKDEFDLLDKLGLAWKVKYN